MAERFVSRPSYVEAIQWQGDNAADVLEFGAPIIIVGTPGKPAIELMAGVDHAQGAVPVPLGHWIVRAPGVMNDHWPVENGYFADKYDPAPAQSPSRGNS